MLGRYENFPNIIHGIARFSYRASQKKAQLAIVSAFYQLNRKKCRLKDIAYLFPPTYEVKFEFGIGEDITFTFLDENELNTLETKITKKALMFLDFLCVLQYHIIDKSRKRAPLKFDYYLLRFAFAKNYMEFLVSHERGPMRVHVEDLINFLTECIKKEMAAKYSVALKPEGKRTV
ncbi:MAG: hypothetical protein ACE5KD_03720 [Candidatus Bathyarchaeia archaeon]